MRNIKKNNKEFHPINWQNDNFIMDTRTFRVAKVSPIINEIISRYDETPNNGCLSDLSKVFGADDVLEAKRVIKDIKNDGLHAKANEKFDCHKGFRSEPVVLYLSVDENCNLRCKYCYASKRIKQKSNNIMSKKTVRKTIDYFFDNYAANKDWVISFVGGEPLMNFEAIKETVNYSKEKAKKFKLRVSFSVTTNGLLLNSVINKYLLDNSIMPVISIDGPPSIHNAARIFADGQGSYKFVMDKAMELLRLYKTYSLDAAVSICSTIIPGEISLKQRIMHFTKLGFVSHGFQPVVMSPKYPFYFSKKDFISLKSEYTSLASWAIKMLGSGGWWRYKGSLFAAFSDYFPFFMGRMQKQHSPMCKAGILCFTVLPNGNIYACPVLAGENRYKMGDIFQGLDCKTRKLYMQNNVDSSKVCRECWARYLCGGGCLAQNGKVNNNLFNPNKELCEFIKHKVELSAIIFSKIAEKTN